MKIRSVIQNDYVYVKPLASLLFMLDLFGIVDYEDMNHTYQWRDYEDNILTIQSRDLDQYRSRQT